MNWTPRMQEVADLIAANGGQRPIYRAMAIKLDLSVERCRQIVAKIERWHRCKVSRDELLRRRKAGYLLDVLDRIGKAARNASMMAKSAAWEQKMHSLRVHTRRWPERMARLWPRIELECEGSPRCHWPLVHLGPPTGLFLHQPPKRRVIDREANRKWLAEQLAKADEMLAQGEADSIVSALMRVKPRAVPWRMETGTGDG